MVELREFISVLSDQQLKQQPQENWLERLTKSYPTVNNLAVEDFIANNDCSYYLSFADDVINNGNIDSNFSYYSNAFSLKSKVIACIILCYKFNKIIKSNGCVNDYSNHTNEFKCIAANVMDFLKKIEQEVFFIAFRSQVGAWGIIMAKLGDCENWLRFLQSPFQD